MKKYVVNTYRGVAGAMEAELATRQYAKKIGAEVAFDESQISNREEAEVVFVDGYDLYLM